jgi:hypothetical protein
MIPKTLFLYWGGKNLSWLRYLTVVSFAKHNPRWTIKVYYPTNPTIGNTWTTDEHIVEYKGDDYFNKLSEYAELIPLDMEQIGGSNDSTEVHKSDLFRLWALFTYGGLYSDFDILYTKPMPDFKEERLYCYHPDGHYAVGLIGCQPGDTKFSKLLRLARQPTETEYQSLGSFLWGKVLEGAKMDGWNIPEELIYSYNWYNAEKLFTDNSGLPDGAIGIHWYGGSVASGQWENLIKPELYDMYDSTICNIIKGIKE